MKFTLSWLKEHLETNADINEICETLTRIGLEVEEVFDPSEGLKEFVSARIESVENHPDADKLHVLCVNDGTNKYQVVCGAPNVHTGLVGIFAREGTLIPLFNERLKRAKIRGVESCGMMCAVDEIGIGTAHDAIIELPADTPIGAPAAEVLDIDPVIEVSITPNRAECLGVRGIARDLAAAGLGKLKPLNIAKPQAKFANPVSVKVENPVECPVYTARYIKGVNNHAKTPDWMKKRLEAIGLRSISPLVDITNYICYDMARPLHVFDADKLKGGIVVKMAQNGEKFMALNEKEYVLNDKSLGICDDEGVQCLGGVMGGLGKGCSEDTVNVVLEAALFKPECIAYTGRHLQIDSDSRYRYERWVDPKSNILGSDYATRLILEICGGEASELTVVGSEDEYKPQVAYLRPERLESFIGMPVTKEKSMEILQNLGFEVSFENGKIKAVTPSWRGDIEGEHDLVEEVVRMIGLDNIPAQSLPHDKLPKEILLPEQHNALVVKHELASRGMYETVTWSFADSEIAKFFRKGKEAILLQNPIVKELDEMRPSILPNLLTAVKNNIAKGYANVALFEVGPEFYGRNPNEQITAASGVRAGNTAKKDWSHSTREYDVFDVKADALAAIAAAKGPYENPQITLDAPSYYHPGRSGTIRLGKNVLAYFGEIHPSILKALDIKERVVAFEVNLNNIPLPRKSVKARKKLELSAFQPVDKDLAFVVDKNISAASLIAAAKNADRNHITDVRIFDVYEGENLPSGKKSLAISLTFQPIEQTFTDKDIENLMNKVIVEVGKKTGGELR